MAEKTETYMGGVTFNPASNQYYDGDHTSSGIPSKQGAFLGTQSVKDDRLNLAYTLNASLSNTYEKLLKQPAFTPLQAAPDGQGNSQNLTHLQLIRLFPQIQGKPTKYFFLENAFVKRSIEKLEFRESFQSVDSLVQTEQERMQEAYKVKNTYSELRYNLKKLLGKVVTPIEDVYRTIINPMTIDYENLKWAFEYRRNRLAVGAIRQTTWGPEGRVEGDGGATQTSGNYTGRSAPVNLGKIAEVSNNGFHSAAHAATQLADACTTFLNHNDLAIDTVVMSSKAYSRWTENTWNRGGGPNGLMPERLVSGAVTTLPGIKNVRCIVDPMLDLHISSSSITTGTDVNGEIFCFNGANALRLGEGPKLSKKYRDEERDADVIRLTDFFQHINVDNALSTQHTDGEEADPYHKRIGNRWFGFKCVFQYGF